MTETPITRTPAAQSPTAQRPTVQAPTVQSPAAGTAAVPGPTVQSPAAGNAAVPGPAAGTAGSAESTAGAKAGTAAGGADPGAADAVIAVRRQRIDELDARIIALVQERMSVSGEIQAARIGSGGRRVHLSRELEVLRTYGGALGKPGTAVAMTLLELCRGRV